jgi:hypothetical protein
MSSHNRSQIEALAALETIAPNAPLLALGQTIFWDEPLKIGVAANAEKFGFSRRLVSGIHDTDYFAKWPQKPLGTGYISATHNDFSTKDLWAAVAEFASLFGSETVITRKKFNLYGVCLEKIRKHDSSLAENLTEAWGWKALVGLGEPTKLTCQTDVEAVYIAIVEMFASVGNKSIDYLSPNLAISAEDKLHSLINQLNEINIDKKEYLSDFYQIALEKFFNLLNSEFKNYEISSTASLLRFNLRTCHLPRFEFVNHFIDPVVAEFTKSIYNQVLDGSDIYSVEEFGEYAIPFDLVIPEKGRGTICISPGYLEILTPQPIQIKLLKPIESIDDLARVVQAHFGLGCTLVGKAVTLIGMLAREFVFVFHEGASSYVRYSKQLHQKLNEKKIKVSLNPILRVHYKTWDVFDKANVQLSLPNELAQAFERTELSSNEFAQNWASAHQSQMSLLNWFAHNGSIDALLSQSENTLFLDLVDLAKQYKAISAQLHAISDQLKEIRLKKDRISERLKGIKLERVQLQLQMGEHWRKYLFGQPNIQSAGVHQKERADFEKKFEAIAVEKWQLLQELKALLSQQEQIVKSPEAEHNRKKREEIELNIAIKKAVIIRNAMIVTEGLNAAARRPSWWWFYLLNSDLEWYTNLVNQAHYELEPLV